MSLDWAESRSSDPAARSPLRNSRLCMTVILYAIRLRLRSQGPDRFDDEAWLIQLDPVSACLRCDVADIPACNGERQCSSRRQDDYWNFFERRRLDNLPRTFR